MCRRSKPPNTKRRIFSGRFGKGRDHYAEPAGTQEPPDVRELRRAKGSVSKPSYASDVKTVVVTGAGGNFCSGGDVHEIIGPLVKCRRPMTCRACSPSRA